MPATQLGGFSMSTQTYHFSVLAFCLFLKSRRANSVIYGDKKAYIACKEFDLNVETYCKYIKVLKALNLIDTDGAGNMHIASIPKLLKALIPGLEGKTFTAFRHCRFFAGMPVQSSVKAYKKQIEVAIIKLDHDQQQYHIDSKNEIKKIIESGSTSSITSKQYAHLQKQYKANCLESLSRAYDTLTDFVVTGKNRFAYLLGVSATTGTKRLRTWHNEGIIQRTIKSVFIPAVVCYASSDLVKGDYAWASPNKNRTGFWATLGSAIKMVTNAQKY